MLQGSNSTRRLNFTLLRKLETGFPKHCLRGFRLANG